MKANPGGQIGSDNVIGRDRLIDSLWSILDQQSILLTAERRTGKTTILKKMLGDPNPKFFPIYQDLEGVSTPDEFVEATGLKLKPHLKPIDSFLYQGDRFLNRFGGSEAKGVKLPMEKQKNWKSHLPSLIEKVHLKEDRTLLFFWDELPLMLYNIKAKCGPQVAMDVLDVIRNLRQEKNIRMILTGSIGLHHVIDQLKRDGYSNAPTNDLCKTDVPPLEDEHAQQLATLLLEGEQIALTDKAATARHISKIADNVPFFIHHIIVSLKLKGKSADSMLVEQVAEECISKANDPWNLRYYRERIITYYRTEDEAPISIAILDYLSCADKPATLNDLVNQVNTQLKTGTRELTKEALRLLELDHYITKDSQNEYQFRSTLVKRWWQQSL